MGLTLDLHAGGDLDLDLDLDLTLDPYVDPTMALILDPFMGLNHDLI